MAGRTYPRLTIEDFGKHLLETGDLDPIYIALYDTQKNDLWSDRKLFRWLLSYWCFYNAGVASYLSELDDNNAFWTTFSVAAANSRDNPCPLGVGDVNGGWPRGAERRHFRGAQAIKATHELVTKFTDPADCVRHLCDGKPFGQAVSYKEIKARVKTLRGFGDWISFKVGDMLERLGILPVQFGLDDAMYADPTKAALMQWKVWHGAPADSTIDDEPAAVREVVDRLILHFRHYSAAPTAATGGRPVGFQEVETILCKWKSHVRGHYPLLNDTTEIRHGVSLWAAKGCVTAGRFMENLPNGKQRSQEAA